MKKVNSALAIIPFIIVIAVLSSCQKTNMETLSSDAEIEAAGSGGLNAPTPANPNFNLEVILRGEGKSFGLVKFRQANDAAKIVTLDTWVRDMLPNHEYKLQRAVDVNLDGNCTGTAWLTLGKGLLLNSQSIFTDENGTGRAELYRSLSAVASGATFDIHFQVIDATNSAVVLTSDCYQYTVR